MSKCRYCGVVGGHNGKLPDGVMTRGEVAMVVVFVAALLVLFAVTDGVDGVGVMVRIEQFVGG